jgi:hypothetical protein
MAVVITPSDLGGSLEVVANKVEVNYDATLQQNGAGELGVVPATITAVETPVTVGAGQPNFLMIMPAGVNGHEILIAPNWADPDFVEAVQDAVGQAILSAAAATITYDDVANTIATTLGNLAFPVSVKTDIAGNITLDGDVLSPGANRFYGTDAVGVKGWNPLPPTGVSDDAGNYLTNGSDGKAYLGVGPALVDVTDLSGNHLFYGLA